MFENFSERRARRLRKRKIKRFIVFAIAIIVFSSIIAIQSSPVLLEKLDSLIFLAKQVLVVPEPTQAILTAQPTTTQIKKTQTALPETSTSTSTEKVKETIIATSTPRTTIKILTGLPDGTVYMRQGPSLIYPAIRILAENDKMIFMKCVNGWAEIEIDNLVGFVYSKYTNANCER